MQTVDVVGLRCGEVIQPGRDLTALKQPSLDHNVKLMSHAELTHLAHNHGAAPGPSTGHLNEQPAADTGDVQVRLAIMSLTFVHFYLLLFAGTKL